uniref:Uncharacterized protein n=1 Tax=Globisporangium ultimum (strain ATCC 200006 / CBS 805.95 / DAOM BR144) TaxID=431595 RepID=K3W606_GLOUD
MAQEQMDTPPKEHSVGGYVTAAESTLRAGNATETSAADVNEPGDRKTAMQEVAAATNEKRAVDTNAKSDKPADGESAAPSQPVGDADLDEELPMADEEEETSLPAIETPKEEEPAPSSNPEAKTHATEEPVEVGNPTLAPSAAPSITPEPVTTKPLLRTENAAVADSSALRSHLNQGSPLLLVSFAAICCVFLIMWVRKRKYNGSGGGATDGGVSEGGSSSKKITSKVQYSRIENDHENIFANSAEDDEEEDEFENDNNKWDDWEGDMGRLSDEGPVTTNAYNASLYANPNPFAAAPVASSYHSPEHSTPKFHLNPPPSSHTPELHDILVSSSASASTSKETGPGSNSSSDSYEVVTDDPVLLHSSPFTSSKKKSPGKPSEGDSEKQAEEDDLFSQFGMVPTFKKSVQPSPPASRSTFSQPASSSSNQSGAAVAAAAAPVSAAAASALFAAEMEDLSIGAASDEWGEDDEWVQGI